MAPIEQNQSPDVFLMKVIWGALCMALVVYSFLAFQMQGMPLMLDFGSPFELILLGIGLGNIVIAFVVFNVLAAPARQAQSYDEAKQKYFVPFVIRIVLIESCSILGFVASTSAEKNVMFFFVVPSLLAMFVIFPTKSKIEGMIKRMPLR